MQLKRLRDQAGFTLIELLIAIVVLGIVSVPVGNLVIQYFDSETAATARLGQSHDAQITNAYWQQDVSSIGLRGQFDTVTNSFPFLASVNVDFHCTLPAGYTQVVTLAWDQPPPASDQTSQVFVEYATTSAVENGQSVLHLVRITCLGATTSPSSPETYTLGTVVVLAHSLAGAPTVTCAGGIGTGCNGTGSASSSITLSLSISDPAGKYSPYGATFTGQRRQST